MKKYFYNSFLFFLLIGLSQQAISQIPNAGFENWTDGIPTGWYGIDTNYIKQSGQAHGGSYGVRIPTVAAGGYFVSSPFITGPDGTYDNALFLCNCQPEAVRFWYIFNSVGGDNFSALGVGVRHPGNTGAGGSFITTTSTTVYKEGGANLVYDGAGNLDSMSVSFKIGPTFAHEGSYVIIDDVAFGPTFTPTSIDNPLEVAKAALEPIQPNPVTNHANIIYNLSGNTQVALDVYDITGRLVKALVNEKQTPGRYKAIWNVEDMPTGTYFCRLSADGNVMTDKIFVTK